MRNAEITLVCLEKAPWYGFDEQGVGGLYCKVIITKTGCWDNNDQGYRYNGDL